MAATAGPDIVDNGLVLALDAADFNSFKGEATTNELVAVNWAGDGANQASFAKGTVSITDEFLKYKGYETYLWSPGGSLNCYLYSTSLSTLRTSTVWTFSCYVKREDGAAITSLNVYMYYPNSDGSAAGTIENVGNGWYRVSRTRTGTDNYLSLVGFTGFAANTKYYLSGAQLEKKSYATTVTTTNTTRGTTVATGGGWEDLTGRGSNGTLTNNPTYSSSNGGCLVFDGTDDNIQLGNASNFISASQSTFTINSWVKTNVTGAYKKIFCTITSDTSSITGIYFSIGPSPYNTYLGIITNNGNQSATYTTDISTTQYSNLCGTYDGSNIRLYLNGTLVATQAQTGNIVNTGIARISGYDNNNETWNGNIGQLSIYNRALTATEVQKNFNETRSRFGI